MIVGAPFSPIVAENFGATKKIFVDTLRTQCLSKQSHVNAFVYHSSSDGSLYHTICHNPLKRIIYSSSKYLTAKEYT